MNGFTWTGLAMMGLLTCMLAGWAAAEPWSPGPEFLLTGTALEQAANGELGRPALDELARGVAHEVAQLSRMISLLEAAFDAEINRRPELTPRARVIEQRIDTLAGLSTALQSEATRLYQGGVPSSAAARKVAAKEVDALRVMRAERALIASKWNAADPSRMELPTTRGRVPAGRRPEQQAQLVRNYAGRYQEIRVTVEVTVEESRLTYTTYRWISMENTRWGQKAVVSLPDGVTCRDLQAARVVAVRGETVRVLRVKRVVKRKQVTVMRVGR